MEDRFPGRYPGFRNRWQNSDDGRLVEHGRDPGSLNGDQVTADSVDDGLEDDEALERIDSAVQNQTSQTENGKKAIVI